ncbi:type-F conjugative transfer system protein TrbI [Pectobacterium brasiliense]|nr:type-F conjugative transfer system protein TrbI [Pectobacterium brasiliense]
MNPDGNVDATNIKGKEQNSFGLDQVRDGISIGEDKVSKSFKGFSPFQPIKVIYIMAILFSFLGVIFIIAIFAVRMTAPQIVSFDMKGTIDLFMQQSAQQNQDDRTARILTERFNQALTESINNWQADHNAIILVAPAVISTKKDITGDIRHDIAIRMQKGG